MAVRRLGDDNGDQLNGGWRGWDRFRRQWSRRRVSTNDINEDVDVER
jgi:hypothetical protein